MEKKTLREKFRTSIKQLDKAERETQSKQILSGLVQYLTAEKGYWSLYHPLNDEPNLLPLQELCSHLHWLFPKTDGDQGLHFYQPEADHEFQENSWGLKEPDPEHARSIPLSEIGGFIIPALAYDRSGVRLGRGGGFYDKTLPANGTRRIGVVFAGGLSTEPLPREAHDRTVDVVMTPNEIIEVKEVNNGFN